MKWLSSVHNLYVFLSPPKFDSSLSELCSWFDGFVLNIKFPGTWISGEKKKSVLLKSVLAVSSNFVLVYWSFPEVNSQIFDSTED